MITKTQATKIKELANNCTIAMSRYMDTNCCHFEDKRDAMKHLANEESLFEKYVASLTEGK